MKGTKKQTNKKKAKGKGTAKASKRTHLHSGNHAYNVQRKTRTKLRRVQTGLPGTPQGKHLKDGECRCGACANKDAPPSTKWFKGMSDSQIAIASLGEEYFVG